ncbi:MAG: crossover junction endodeoxyribonuclease RuvC [Elusimicrobiota bacterium]
MKIMGIDPGLANVGWGIIKETDNSKFSLVNYGCISTSSSDTFIKRLDLLYKRAKDLVEKYNPEEVAVEELFFSANTKTAINVAHARGAVMVALNHSGMKVSEYTPLEIKQALVGYGKAKKSQVQYMVKQFLNLDEIPHPGHSADALAAALCHCSSRKLNNLIK